MSIPPRFAAMFCIMKVNAIYFRFPVDSRTKKPSGRNVRSAISFAISIEPIKVMQTSAITAMRRFPVQTTIFRETKVKKPMFLRAQTTASVQKRQVSVLRSKYPR